MTPCQSLSDGLVVSKALKEKAAAKIAEVQDLDLNAPPPREEDDGSDEDRRAAGGAAGPSGRSAGQQRPAGGGVNGPGGGKAAGASSAGLPRKSLFDELDEEGVEEDPEKEVLAFEVLPDQVGRPEEVRGDDGRPKDAAITSDARICNVLLTILMNDDAVLSQGCICLRISHQPAF